MTECHCYDKMDGVSGACFDRERTSRYVLWRNWNAAHPVMVALMLNPSIADENDLDPTLTRVSRYAMSWGFGGMRILNAFSVVSTDPDGLKGIYLSDRRNDWHIRRAISDPRVGRVMLGWGANLERRDYLRFRRAELAELLAFSIAPLYAWRLTKSGEPTHPLYLPADIAPTPFDRRAYASRLSGGGYLHAQPTRIDIATVPMR